MHSVLVILALIPQSGRAGGLAPEMQAVLEAAPAELHSGYALMETSLTADHFRGRVEGLDKRERRQLVMDELRAFADASQAELLPLVRSLEAQGHARRVHQMWILNGIVLEGDAVAWRAIAAAPGVAIVRYDPPRDEAELADVPLEDLLHPPAPRLDIPRPLLAASNPEPNIVQHQAPKLWALGIDGSGVVICNIDSGADRTHPDLANRIWSNPLDPVDGIDNDNNGYVDDYLGWDFTGNDNDPPPGGHGTNTAGIMVGDGAGGRCTGMAPGASLALCAVTTEAHHWLAKQWAISVLAIDVISSSYSWKWPFSPRPDYHSHRQSSDMVWAAGMIHANSIGNQGTQTTTYPIPFNISAPGNVPGPWRHPDQVQSGGVSSVLGCLGIQLSDDGYYDLSGKGPSAWEDMLLYDPAYPHPQNPAYWDYPHGGFGGGLPGLLKPDIAGYTLINNTTRAGGGYVGFSGTSCATPHVGGAMVLLFAANPHALPRQISQALQVGAEDRGVSGKDTLWGAGKMLVLNAALRVMHLATATDPEPRMGLPTTISLSGPPGKAFTLYRGKALGSTPVPGGILEIKGGKIVTRGRLDALGRFDFTAVVPSKPSLVNRTIFLQSVCDDRSGTTGVRLFSLVEPVTIRP